MISYDGPDRIGRVDHALAAAGSALAVYCTGMSIGKPPVAQFFAAEVVIATIIGYVLAKRFRSSASSFDTGAYVVLALLSIFAAIPLNRMIPADGYPAQLMVAGALSWMLVFGSLTAWRDSTLLFQAVPSIALFGLTGCFDTYGPAVPLFFVFLICASTLFARAHYRSMLRLAEGAYAASVAFAGEQRSALAARLEQGPWRWMAGPLWGLVSAGLVVAISFIGAPVIQRSIEPLVTTVTINLPVPPAARAGQGTRFESNDTTLRVGQGPRGPLSERTVLRVRMDRPRYLRGSTFIHYNGRGWDSKGLVSQTGSIPYDLDPPREMPDGRLQLFAILFDAGRHDKFYLPGEPLLARDRGLTILADGTVRPPQSITAGVRIAGHAWVPDEDVEPTRSAIPPHYKAAPGEVLDASRASHRVRLLARSAVQDKATDFEKAVAIKHAIESRVRYNLKAKPIPVGQDAVDTFLFETKEGYCDLFASAMALLARCEGLPSRVVTGFYPISGDRDPEGRFIVKESEYHAWCEIYFAGLGWLPFDPTEGAQEVRGAGRGGSTDGQQEWFERPAARAGIAVLAAFIAGFFLFMLLRSTRSAAPDAMNQERRKLLALVRAFQSSVKVRVGRPRRMHETLAEYAGELPDTYRQIQARLDSLLYGPNVVDPGVLNELRERVRKLAKEPQPE